MEKTNHFSHLHEISAAIVSFHYTLHLTLSRDISEIDAMFMPMSHETLHFFQKLFFYCSRALTTDQRQCLHHPLY